MVNKTKGYGQMHWDIYEDERLSWQEATLCCYLADVFSTLKQKKIVDGKEYRRLADSFIQYMFSNPNSKDGCISSNTIKKYLDRLEEEGYIEILPETQKFGRYYRMSDVFIDEFCDVNTDRTTDINTDRSTDRTTDRSTDRKKCEQINLSTYQPKQPNNLSDIDTEAKASDSSKKKSKERNTDEFLEQEYEVIDYFNLVTNSNYRKTPTCTFRKLLKKLFEDGYTKEQMKSVIDKKYASLKGTEFESGINPNNLFGEKWETHLNSNIYVSPQKEVRRTVVNLDDYRAL